MFKDKKKKSFKKEAKLGKRDELFDQLPGNQKGALKKVKVEEGPTNILDNLAGKHYNNKTFKSLFFCNQQCY